MLKKIKRIFTAPKNLEQQNSLNDYLMQRMAFVIERELNRNEPVTTPPFEVSIVMIDGVKKIKIFRDHERRLDYGSSDFCVYFIFTVGPWSDDKHHVYKALECSRYIESDPDYTEWYRHVKLTLIDIFVGFQIIETDGVGGRETGTGLQFVGRKFEGSISVKT